MCPGVGAVSLSSWVWRKTVWRMWRKLFWESRPAVLLWVNYLICQRLSSVSFKSFWVNDFILKLNTHIHPHLQNQTNLVSINCATKILTAQTGINIWHQHCLIWRKLGVVATSLRWKTLISGSWPTPENKQMNQQKPFQIQSSWSNINHVDLSDHPRRVHSMCQLPEPNNSLKTWDPQEVLAPLKQDSKHCCLLQLTQKPVLLLQFLQALSIYLLICFINFRLVLPNFITSCS